jgi:hypothetical protein
MVSHAQGLSHMAAHPAARCTACVLIDLPTCDHKRLMLINPKQPSRWAPPIPAYRARIAYGTEKWTPGATRNKGIWVSMTPAREAAVGGRGRVVYRHRGGLDAGIVAMNGSRTCDIAGFVGTRSAARVCAILPIDRRKQSTIAWRR